MISRQRLWEIINLAQHGDIASRIFDITILILIVLNIIALILASIDSVKQQYGVYLHYFELFCVFTFTIEYILRVWSCVSSHLYQAPIKGRLRYMLQPVPLLDLLAILPFYLSLLDVNTTFLRFARLLRVIRIAEISRYYTAIRALTNVLKNSREELILTFFSLFFVLLTVSCLVYYVENPVQPEAFPDIPTTLWWGFVTLTTIGYGDIFPITALGRALTAVFAVLGIGLFAIPGGILASGFMDELQKRREQQCSLHTEDNQHVTIRVTAASKQINYHVHNTIAALTAQNLRLINRSDILPCHETHLAGRSQVFLHFEPEAEYEEVF
jgi:voltage-gated potassium channel